MTHHTTFRPAALLLGTLLACGSSFAATKAEVQAQYQKERAACTTGKSNQDQKTCLYEAVSAYNQAMRGALSDSSAPYEANQRKRCEPLPTDQRLACLSRMDGQGSVSGSVMSGGLLRELVTIERMDPVAAAPDQPTNAQESSAEQ